MGILKRLLGNKSSEKAKLTRFIERQSIRFECESKVIRDLNLQGRGLSIGVGTGILDSQALVEVGIDPSISRLRLAASFGIKAIRSVGEYLPLRDRSFDFVFMIETICFLDSPTGSISEANRVLNYRGVISICFIPRNSAWGEEYMKKAEYFKLNRIPHFYNLSELECLLRKHSFKTLSIKATLSYLPSEEPRVEEPSENYEGKGLVCIKAIKNQNMN